jgi:LPS-assembly protein
MTAVRGIFSIVLVLLSGAAAHAQLPFQPQPQQLPVQPQSQPPAPRAGQPPVADTTISDRREATNDQKDWIFIGNVEFNQNKDTTIYADKAWFYTDGNRFIAEGNVVFSQGDNRISAERVEFNTETRLGTFYQATGIATVKPQVPQVRPGAFAPPPPMAGQQTMVYFFGETIEKVGPRKYKITKGGFSTCVQPTPRWDLHAGTVILNVEHYTMMKNAILSVKGVPMFYLPVMYYPTKKDDRATGFLIPTYGASSLKGQSIHNAFFWAINRSQDATVAHDWYSKTGQGVGSEYRYNFGPVADGNIRAYLLDQHDATYTDTAGKDQLVPASRSYEIHGSSNQLLPGGIRARGRIDYFSSIKTSQTFNTNIYDASRNTRSYGGNLIGAWGTYTMNATLDHSEYFYDLNSSSLSGSWPRVSFSRNERPFLGGAAYLSLGTEFVRVLRESDSTDTTTKVTTISDFGLSRFDVNPQIRYPFKKWQWFTVNSTVGWRDTYYSRSMTPLDVTPGAPAQTLTEASLNRRFFIVGSQIVGPVFNRIWDTPANGYAEKFKHSIEPVLTVQLTSNVGNYDQVIQSDGIDGFVGGGSYTYGLNNRFYAKRKLTPGGLAQSREIIGVELSQTYYTDQRQSLSDRQYQTNQVAGALDQVPQHFSPIALNVRAMPTNELSGTLRAEFDARYHALKTITSGATYTMPQLQVTASWTKKGLIPLLSGFNDPALLDQSLGGTANVHTKDNKVGTIYNFNFDVLHSTLLQQRVSGFYNAQCCGLAFEYQTYNFGALSGVSSALSSDHRFFISFTLAGLGNFSPFNGAMSGVPR